MAVAQQALVDDVVSQFGAPPLGHAGLGAVRQPLVLEPQALQTQQACAFDFGVECGKRMRHTLKGGQRLAKGLPLRDVFPGFVQGHAGDRQALQAD